MPENLLQAVPSGSGLRRWLREKRLTLSGGELPAPPKRPYSSVQLTYWAPKSLAWVNFGDELSKIITTLMLAKRGITFDDETRDSRQLLAIGSILHFARNGAVVWGSGVNGAKAAADHVFDALDVRAVRGPYTAEFLKKKGISVPEVYGDPALLLPGLIGSRFSANKRRSLGIVPNMHDLSRIPQNFSEYVIDPRRSWNRVVADILDCRFIVASSLHGIVIAEAFGIPAQYVRLTDAEGILKYKDYYEGSGRSSFNSARSIEEAIEMGGEVGLAWSSEALEAAFPFDIWQD